MRANDEQEVDVLTLQERRELKREEMKEDILALARRQMRANGAAALSLNQIARDLGMKTPSLYVYFPSKMAIYDALFRRGFEMYAARLAREELREGTFTEQLQNAIEAYFSFAVENPELYQIMFERPVPDFVPSEESMAVSLTLLAQARERVTKLLERERFDTELSVPGATDLLIALTHGLTALHLANEPHLALGEGRFGSLIPHAARLFARAWKQADE